jgi:hypothetical protein
MLSSNKFFYNFVLSITFIVFIFYSSLTFSKEKFENCENIINKIESYTDLPKGLLTAIGKVESGRLLKNKKYVVWPWTVNHAGKSLFFDTKKQMEKYVLKNVRVKDHNIDDMFALEPNISYAASFLIQLKNRHGSWDEAIKYYHSSDPKKNKPYLNKVKKFWKIKKQKKYVNKTKKSDTMLITERIKDTQPYLFKRIDKVNFFRKIFAQNK